MKHARWLLPLTVLCCWSQEGSAQLPFSPFVPGYAVGPGIGFNYRHRHLAVSGFLAPPLYGYGVRGWPPYYPYYPFPTSTVTYIYSPPPSVVMMPPIVINNNNNQTVVVGNGMQVDREDDGQFLKIIPRQRRPAEEAAAPERNGRPMRPAEPKERPAGKEPAVEAKPKAKPEPARPAPRNPREENARLAALGKQAFEDQQHGLAERRFQKAVEAAPAEPMAYFLLAQAQFALGKYREAVESIHAGMRRHPDWPSAAFDPRDLYGDNPEDFQDHLKRLDEVLAANPNDPVVLFLAAHQLWFTGKVAEARALFARAARIAPERIFSDRFLKGRPAGPVARK